MIGLTIAFVQHLSLLKIHASLSGVQEELEEAFPLKPELAGSLHMCSSTTDMEPRSTAGTANVR